MRRCPMLRRIVGVAALFLAAPVLAGEMDQEFAGKASPGPALTDKTAFSSVAPAAEMLSSSLLARATVANRTELDAESHIQAARGGGGGRGGGGVARGG